MTGRSEITRDCTSTLPAGLNSATKRTTLTSRVTVLYRLKSTVTARVAWSIHRSSRSVSTTAAALVTLPARRLVM